jgi:hypothetical protein
MSEIYFIDKMEQETNQDRQDMLDFLQLQHADVRENCKIVSSEELGQDFFIRIDKHVPESFYPNMPKSAAPSENTTIPRITCAPTLIGCMIGYFRIERDVIDGTFKPAGDNRPKFAGGYKISRLPFKYSLKPGSKLVIDSESSDEHWLVPHDVDMVDITPDVVGEIHVDRISYLPVSGHWPGVELVIYAKIDADMTLRLNDKTTIGKGYWVYTVRWENIRLRSVKQDCLKEVREISEEEYSANKLRRAAMLSVEVGASLKKW